MSRRASPKKGQEAALVTELQAIHGFMIVKLPNKRDRFVTMWRELSTKKASCVQGVALKLVVPLSSALGSAMARAYDEETNKKPATKRARRNKR